MSRQQTRADEELVGWTSRVATVWTGRWTALRDEFRERWAMLRREPDAGYSTETVLVTALLVAAALVVIAIIVGKVTEKANEIDLGFAVGHALVAGQGLGLGLGLG